MQISFHNSSLYSYWLKQGTKFTFMQNDFTMKKLFLIFITVFLSFITIAQKFQPAWSSLNQRKNPAWFQQDKFGIFIHWGTYSVPAYAPVLPNSDLSYAEWYWK